MFNTKWELFISVWRERLWASDIHTSAGKYGGNPKSVDDIVHIDTDMNIIHMVLGTGF